jgi:hypothetical protein
MFLNAIYGRLGVEAVRAKLRKWSQTLGQPSSGGGGGGGGGGGIVWADRAK